MTNLWSLNGCDPVLSGNWVSHSHSYLLLLSCVHYGHVLLHTHLFPTACGESLCSACILPIHFTDVESTGAMPSPVMLCYKCYYEPTLPFLAFFSSHSAISLLPAVCNYWHIYGSSTISCSPSCNTHLLWCLVHRNALYWLVNSWLFNDAVWTAVKQSILRHSTNTSQEFEPG